MTTVATPSIVLAGPGDPFFCEAAKDLQLDRAEAHAGHGLEGAVGEADDLGLGVGVHAVLQVNLLDGRDLGGLLLRRVRRQGEGGQEGGLVGGLLQRADRQPALLAVDDVPADRLAEDGRIALGIQIVVRHLESQTQLITIFIETAGDRSRSAASL